MNAVGVALISRTSDIGTLHIGSLEILRPLRAHVLGERLAAEGVRWGKFSRGSEKCGNWGCFLFSRPGGPDCKHFPCKVLSIEAANSGALVINEAPVPTSWCGCCRPQPPQARRKREDDDAREQKALTKSRRLASPISGLVFEEDGDDPARRLFGNADIGYDGSMSSEIYVDPEYCHILMFAPRESHIREPENVLVSPGRPGEVSVQHLAE